MCTMRLLLTGILAVFPLTIHAELLDTHRTSTSDPNFLADSADAWNEANPDNAIKELAPYGNPYAPASLTNFEALIGPYLYIQGRGNLILYDARSPSTYDVNHGKLDSLGSIDHRNSAGVSSTPSVSSIPAVTAGWYKETYGRHNLNKAFPK